MYKRKLSWFMLQITAGETNSSLYHLVNYKRLSTQREYKQGLGLDTCLVAAGVTPC